MTGRPVGDGPARTAASGNDGGPPLAERADGAPGAAVRERLLRLDRVDRSLRGPWAAGGFRDAELADRLSQLTTQGIAWLRDVVAAYGWPGHRLVGPEAAAAASRLLQHATGELEFRHHCLSLMRRAADSGDLPYREVAYLTDTLALAEGRAQWYGTKFERTGDDPTALQPLPLNDPEGVDDRRARAGLPPLATYTALLHEKFTDRPADDGNGPENEGSSTVDWQTFHARYWDQRPVRLSGADPSALTGTEVFPADDVFALARHAAEPFRLGTRAHATADVTFFTPRGQLRSPGDLLPGPEDRDLPAYARRVSGADGTGEGPDAGWHWSVTNPFGLDQPLWARARDVLSGLWRHAGWPAAPLVSEIAAGDGFLRARGQARPTGVAVLVWVLRGSFHAALWNERADLPADPADFPEPDHRLHGGPGDLLHWPSDVRYTERFADDCLIVRFAVHAVPRPAEALLKNLLADRLGELPRYAEGAPCHLPFPPPAAADGRAGPVDWIAETGTRLHDDLRGADLHRTLRTQWALRRSAAGLEPVPRPAPDSALAADTSVRVVSEIIRMPDGEGALWAVNGHPLALGGGTAELIRRRLTPGRVLSATDLCGEIGADPSDERARAQVLTLLRTLHRMHAVADAAPAASATAPGGDEADAPAPAPGAVR